MTVLAQAEPFCQAYFFLIYRWSILPAWISNFDHQSILQYKLEVRLLPYKIDHQYSFLKIYDPSHIHILVCGCTNAGKYAFYQ